MCNEQSYILEAGWLPNEFDKLITLAWIKKVSYPIMSIEKQKQQWRSDIFPRGKPTEVSWNQTDKTILAELKQ